MKEKIKDKPKVNVPEQIKEQYRPKKEGRSTFDKIMEQNKLLQKDVKTRSQPMLQKSGDNESRIARRQEHGGRERDSRSDEKEREMGKERAKDERRAGAETGPRIIGKGKKDGSSSGQGGSKGGRGQGFGGSVAKKTMISGKKSGLSSTAQAAAESSRFASALKAQLKSARLSREFLQNIVNQIVKSVKSGLNEDGDKEVRLDLHERIFRGLQLRVAMKHGKVSVHFNTSSREVKELFESSSDAIQKELQSKGIEIGDIKVT